MLTIPGPSYIHARIQGRASGRGWYPDQNTRGVVSVQSLQIFGIQIEEYDVVEPGRGS